MTVEHHSYLVRIWRDTTFGSTPCEEWQGEVEHIQSGSCWIIKSVEGFLDAIKIDQEDKVLKEAKQRQTGTRLISKTSTESSTEERKNDK